jgi:hypothetical protein
MKTNTRNNRTRRPRAFPTVNHHIVWFQVGLPGHEQQLIGIAENKINRDGSAESRFPSVEALASNNHVVSDTAMQMMQAVHVEILDRFHEATDNRFLDFEEDLHIRPVTFKAPKTSTWTNPRFNRELEAGRKKFRETGLIWEPKGRWVPGIDAAGQERLVWQDDEGTVILPIPQRSKEDRAWDKLTPEDKQLLADLAELADAMEVVR